MLDICIDDTCIAQAIATTPKHSAGGLDGWRIKELARFPPALVSLLTLLLQSFHDNGWPTVFGLTKVSLPPKKDNPFLPSHGRPICVLSQLFRLWSKALARQILDNFASWIPKTIIGGLPKRGTSHVWYDQQWLIEDSHAAGVKHFGFAMDVQKCFNGVPRKPLGLLLLKLGVPRQFVTTWLAFLDIVVRSVVIKNTASSPSPSFTGIPEGDPMSVPAMIAICYAWQQWLFSKLSLSQHTCWAYLDNMELTTDSLPTLCSGISECWFFLKSWMLLPDIAKSWTWCTGKLSLAEKQTIQETSEHLGHLKIVEHATDLGASLRYKGGHRVANIREKFASSAQRVCKLYGLPLKLSQQWRAITAGCISRALYAIEIVPLGFNHFQNFEAKLQMWSQSVPTGMNT